MKFTEQQIAFIIYNNRSVEGVVKNFIPKNLNPFKLQKLEQRLHDAKLKYTPEGKNVKVEINKLNLDCEDIIVNPEDLENLTEMFIEASGKFSEIECRYLQTRGINWNPILSSKTFGLSQIKDKKALEIMGSSIHPILTGFLDNVESGIVFPLYESGKLVNCAIRKIGVENDGKSKTLKYTLAVPDIHVWGLTQSNEIWLTEGIFDSMALWSRGYKSVTSSSAAWSSIQLLKVIELNPKLVNIFSDNDLIGLKNSQILKDVFEEYGIQVKIFISEFAKDASEHIFYKSMCSSEIKEITLENINLCDYTDDFDIINHLKNRKF